MRAAACKAHAKMSPTREFLLDIAASALPVTKGIHMFMMAAQVDPTLSSEEIPLSKYKQIVS